MNNFKQIRSMIAFALMLAMIFSTFALSSCDIFNSLFGNGGTGSGNGDNILNDPMPDPIDDNYRTLYQIYVRSFADSDGDGIGDIRGIIETFDYLNDGDMANGTDLGVQAIWLTPIFEGNSPHKYDAIDFYNVDPTFGTKDDLVELIELCDKRNVKLILDLALNHTSTSCSWFQQSKKARINGDKSNKYYDYYVWSTSEQTGYTKLSGHNLWYESRFDVGGSMPDLNYDNQAVRNEMLNVAKYWLELGVDGFRFDAVKYIYFENHVKSPEFYNWFNGELRKEYPDIYLIGECWDTEANILKYYKSMNCFYFPLAGNGALASAGRGTGPISTFTSQVESFQSKINSANPKGMMSLFLSNHDQDRSAGYIVGTNQRKMAASLYLLTPGTPVIYYGEEIGLKGSGDSPDDANRRLPFKWGDVWTCEPHHQATYSIDLWDDTADDQRKDEDSLLIHYTKVLNIRHSYPAIARGTYKALYTGKANCGGFLISYNDENLVLLHNTSATETMTIDLKKLNNLNAYTYFMILETVGVSDASLDGTVLTLGPQTSVLLQ